METNGIEKKSTQTVSTKEIKTPQSFITFITCPVCGQQQSYEEIGLHGCCSNCQESLVKELF